MNAQNPIDEQAWDRCARAGDRATRNALTPTALRMTRTTGHPAAGLAVAVGALVAVGELLAALPTQPAAHRVMEEMAAAYLLGALRRADGPLNPDGTTYTGARLDG